MKKFKYVALSFLALLGTASIISCGKKNNGNNDKTSEKQIDKCVLTTINSDLFAGTITNYNNLKLNIGTEIILLAKPQYGYSFDGWYYGENKISDETNYRFTIYSDLELTAKWHMDFKTYALNTINVDTKCGSISDYQDQRLKEGDEVSVSASANEGYEFDGWYEGNDKVSDSSLYTFNIDHNTVLFVRWKKSQGETTKYTLTTINDNSNAGNITSYTNQEFDEGASVTLTANNNSGFEFDGWYNGDEKISSSSSYTFNINSNLVLTAKWITSSIPDTKYTLTTINDNSNAGNITSYTNQEFNSGESVTLTAEADFDYGYTFNGWYNGDTKVSSSSSYTFNINSNLTLTAKWVYYTLTTTPCYNSSNDVPDGKQYYNIAGTFTILENEKVSAGNTVTLVCVPKEESVTFVGWYKVNASSMELLSTNQSYTYTMTEQDTIIRAKFLLYKYVENTNNKVIEYGFYPQSKVTDDEIKQELDKKIGNLPDAEHDYDWKNYNYYDDDTISNYMWYKDIDLDNDGVKDYRAVYFIKYRGSKTTLAASIGNSYVDNNGYELNNVYYFKFEPVLWDILETTTYGDTIIMSRFIIDAQNWYINTSNRIDGLNTIYPTNYEESSIKNWLNNDFYDTVFDLYRHKNNSLNLTDNSVQSTGKTTNDYALDGIFSDKVYLMSVAEFNQYIKNNNTLKKASSTDYAKIQGLNVSTTSTTAGYSAYWTRSPQNSNINATNISNQGSTSSQVVTEIYGIRPLLDMFL